MSSPQASERDEDSIASFEHEKWKFEVEEL